MEEVLKDFKNLLSSKIIKSGYVDYEQKIDNLLNQYDLLRHNFFTLLLTEEQIDKESFVETKYVKVRYETHPSEIQKLSLKMLSKKHNHQFHWIYDIIHKYYSKNSSNNFIIEKEFSNYLKCLIEGCYPEVLENLLQSWAFEKFTGEEDDYNDQEYRHIIDKNRKEFEEYRRSLFMPIFLKRYELNFEKILPKPLGQFSHSCPIKQYYFIKNNEELLLTLGCACGNETRYQDKLMSEFFSLLEKQGVKINTFIGQIDSHCKFKMIDMKQYLVLKC